MTQGNRSLPTAAELSELHSNKQLYHSNIFRLELDELESTSSVDLFAISAIDELIKSLSKVILECESTELDGSAPYYSTFPLIEPCLKATTHSRLSILPPIDVQVVGSGILRKQLKSNLNIDLAVVMNSSMFDEKDYMNYRYFDKRAAFLAHLYNHIETKLSSFSNSFTLVPFLVDWKGELHKPVINIAVSLKSKGHICNIRVLPSINDWALFNSGSRLVAAQKNVRPHSAAYSLDDEDSSTYYNFSMLEDFSFIALAQNTLSFSQNKCPAFVRTIQLLKTWAQARRLIGYTHRNGAITYTGLTSFELSQILIHVASGSFIAASAAPIQLLKLVFSWLSNLSSEKDFAIASPLNGSQNLLFRCGHLWQELKDLAKESFTAIETKNNPFDDLFGNAKYRTPWYDNVVSLEHTEKAFPVKRILNDLSIPTPSFFSYESPSNLQSIIGVSSLVLYGLTNRVIGSTYRIVKTLPKKCLKDSNIPCLHMWTSKNPLTKEEIQCVKGTWNFVSGLQSDIWRRLDRGPGSNTPEAKSFKKYWGSKCELRKFKDGMITDAVLWPNLSEGSNSERMLERSPLSISEQIIMHTVNTHLKEYININEMNLSLTSIGSYSIPCGVYLEFVQEFQEVSSILRELDSLPVAVKDIHGSGSAFRYTETLLPRSSHVFDDTNSTKKFDLTSFITNIHSPNLATLSELQLVQDVEDVSIPPQEVILELSYESNVIEDEIIDAQKGRLLLKIQRELEKKKSLSTAIHRDFLDIQMPIGVYRVRLLFAHELVQEAIQATNFSSLPSNRPVAKQLNKLRDLWWSASVSKAYHSIGLRVISFSGAVRLLKLWSAAHMFCDCDHVLEALCAYVAHGSNSAISVQRLFLQTLELLATHDWERNILFVQYDDEEYPDRDAALECLQKQREAGLSRSIAPPSLCIASKYDPLCVLIPTPNTINSKRLVKQAENTLKSVHEKVLFTSQSIVANDWVNAIFRTDRGQFDVILKMQSPHALRNFSTKKKSNRVNGATNDDEYANLTRIQNNNASNDSFISTSSTPLDVEAKYAFDQFINNLQTQYGSNVLVFYNSLIQPIPKIVGIKFRPNAILCKGVTASASCPTVSVVSPNTKDKEGAIVNVVNHAALVARIISLGGVLVKGVEYTL